MAFLVPDAVETWNGVSVKRFFLTEHNDNKISLPSKMTKPLIGVTLHNTDRIKVNDTTCAEQYTRATYNGNMKSVRVHFYVDDKEAWQNLPLYFQSWHAGQSGKADANGSAAGNAQTISIECIMDGSGSEADLKARDNAARLIAYLLDNYGGVLYTHNYWCNIRKGMIGDISVLNRKDDGYKNCPIFIRPKWSDFVSLVNKYRGTEKVKKTLYKVQVCACSERSNAEKVLADVKKTYPDAFIVAD